MDFIRDILRELRAHLDLTADKENETAVIENVRRAVDFRGVNLWILVFAVFIASIGLNIDSTPIIIGAMLISPLMGPIIGTGLAVGINDMELMKRSLRNLLVASLFAVFAATLYFLISPLNEARSELLARTSPTLYDVMIALIGGAAGFLALSTTGNHIQVIIGVAISTALLPPLCTVGFGIASGNWLYALGAFYLFFINSVFIAISTFLSVRFFGFASKVFTDREHERHVRRSLIIISVVTLLPSVVLTYNIVRKTVYEQNAEHFVARELDFPGARIIDSNINYENRTIQAVFVGRYLPDALVESVRDKLPEYHLSGTRLLVMQDDGSRDSVMISSLRSEILKDFYLNAQQRVVQLDAEVDSLRGHLALLQRFAVLDSLVYGEARVLFPAVTGFSMGVLWGRDDGSRQVRPYVFGRVEVSGDVSDDARARMVQWLRRRTQEPDMMVEFYTLSTAAANP